ncbi:hypothetical protein K505DRAFT_367284 [Melanomma pulvis-pyrius CBS 109.77]|uniref:Uncharacterized protein n=1 Tax=Melanomma pulvis-pyrius CBS 109.77 TaxID=1314802 RepID=A0A6A6WTV7_9PLEO|nr:hypothetical protein K505DRAFT_367284 [Melanomma pulvis-pyrius CBS 109.77]
MYHILLIRIAFSSLTFTRTFNPSSRNFPAKKDSDFEGGIFSVPLSELPKYTGELPVGGIEAPKGAHKKTAGSSPYPVRMATGIIIPSYIYLHLGAPTGNLKLPFIAWGNDACTLGSGQYENFIVELASYGYIIAADGTPSGFTDAQQ